MANARNINEETEDKNLNKKDKRSIKKAEKKLMKSQKSAENNNENNGAEDEKTSNKLVVVVTTALIILLWVGILGALIKLDVGGFGSNVLSPVLKDVPYLNSILPASNEESEVVTSEYESMAEALQKINELQSDLSDANSQLDNDSTTISDLESEVLRLQAFEDEQNDFEILKAEFYDEVVNGDGALDITEYQKYYESIDPDNAALLYKQVVEQTSYDDKVTEYASAYSAMKPVQAAGILETMTDDLDLVAEILGAMDVDSRGNILGVMDTTIAAKITKLMAPTE